MHVFRDCVKRVNAVHAGICFGSEIMHRRERHCRKMTLKPWSRTEQTWKHRCFWESFDAKTYFVGCYSCKSNFPRTSKGMKWKTKRIKYDPFSPIFSYCTFLSVKFKLSEILLQHQRATHLPACLVKVGIKRSSYTIMSAFDFYACDKTVCFWSHYRCEQLTFYSWLFFCSWSFTDNYFSVDYSHTFIGDTCVTAPVSVSHKL